MDDHRRLALDQVPVHLGLGARVLVQEPFDSSMDWYERYGQRTAADGIEGRLVCTSRYRESWPHWEMHPVGDELVVCLAGSMALHQEVDDEVVTTVLAPGEATINPRGVWHTADGDPNGEVTALYVTAGVGTQHRAR